MTDRLEEFKGRVKEGAGKVTDNERLEAEGEGQAEGARAGRKIKGAAQEAGGAVKEATGKITSDEEAEAEGKADRLGGKATRSG
jgi:uncharacterized protein YjbJ (UPF0337 family)